jgi:glycosyltransferase involved in cell wall biosynthesis
METLGIVVPAYKIIYFEQVLKSIANQTCKNFTVYIGNDGSCEDFETIVSSYQREIPIVYQRFSENLGSRDLVAHWERCIDMAKDEQWIWLFSDDDIMEATCVENFYKSLSENNNADVFHFNISRINEQNEIIDNCTLFPKILSSEDFLFGRLNGSLSSFVMEYIFRKDHFINNHRFENFDLAWGSDDATWIKLGIKRGIHTIENASVFWRKSRFNISPNKWNPTIVYRKLDAQIKFARWAIEKVDNGDINVKKDQLQHYLKVWFIASIKQSIRFFPLKKLTRIMEDFFIAIDEKSSHNAKIISLYNYKLYRFSVELIKTHLIKNKEASWK